VKLVETTMGGLTCRAVVTDAEPESGPEALVVLCHGYGAPGTDLIGLAPELMDREPDLKRARFLFPEAPHPLDMMFGGRAWWHIDMTKLEQAMREGRTREMADEVPEGMDQARRMLHALVDEALAQTGLPMSKVLLGGFSQGAMLATDLTLRLEEAPAGLLIYSGALLSQTEWKKRAPNRSGLKVFQTHGRQDPLLGFAQAEDLKALLDGAGLDVEFDPFDGQHTISAAGVEKGARFLKERLLS
jgi:phospholipase/carboxylesterase